MGVAYYGSKISPHIIKNPAGFLICKDVPIARLGTQKYLAREIGIPERGDDIITVYRLESDVFDSVAMNSFNGAPFTDEHPNDWVQPHNAEGLMKGTVTNTHRGTGKDNDLLLADIVVYGKQQIDEIERKEKREISCGYECEYVPYKDGYKQINIVGNHVALVSAGRAGERVAIKDAAKDIDNNSNSFANERRTRSMGGYKIPRRASVTEFARAVGLKTIAQDAEPEEIMEMVDELVEEKKQEQYDDEPVIIENEPEVKDEDLDELKAQMSEMKDAIYTILSKDAECEDEDEEEIEVEEAEDEDESLESLDALEEELGESEEVEDEDEMEQIEEHEVPPEVINEEAEEEEDEMTTDSIVELSRVLKPIIASIPDSKKRKQVADSLAGVLRKHAKKAQDSKKTNYAKMLNRTKDSNSSNNNSVNIGDEIAKAWNPHYKEGK